MSGSYSGLLHTIPYGGGLAIVGVVGHPRVLLGIHSKRHDKGYVGKPKPTLAVPAELLHCVTGRKQWDGLQTPLEASVNMGSQFYGTTHVRQSNGCQRTQDCSLG
eukprot:scaffold2256_cov371-Prasinococcus_capsulatus_cf.AAC.4